MFKLIISFILLCYIKFSYSKNNSLRKIIFIGLGTGRCGTVSLSKLIDGCKNFKCTHETRNLLPWKFKITTFYERCLYFYNHPFSIGDVGFYYLPYVKSFIQIFPNIKIVCLKRNINATVVSMEKHIFNKNHWIIYPSKKWITDSVWDPMFPKYNYKNRRKAIQKYWMDYYRISSLLENKYPNNFKIFSIDKLNGKSGQDEIFDYINIPKEIRNYIQNCIYNTSA